MAANGQTAANGPAAANGQASANGQTAANEQNIFREKTLERISSPENLTETLRVTSPGIWTIIAVVILILIGLFVWASIGTLETTAKAKAIVKDHTAQVVLVSSDGLEEGMPVRISPEDTVIASVGKDEYGRNVGTAEVNLPDGTYDAEVVTELIRPIEFLFRSN